MGYGIGDRIYGKVGDEIVRGRVVSYEEPLSFAIDECGCTIGRVGSGPITIEVCELKEIKVITINSEDILTPMEVAKLKPQELSDKV